VPPAPREPRPAIDARVAVTRSGAYTVRAAGGVSVPTNAPRLEVDAAVLDERPGEHRHAGMRPDLGMRCVGVRLAVEEGRVVSHEGTLLHFRTLRRELPQVKRHPFGWGARVSSSYDEARLPFLASAEAGPEIAFGDPRLLTHLRLALHGGAGVMDREGPALSARAEAAARVHLGGLSTRHADLRAETRPVVTRDGIRWLSTVEASVELGGERWAVRPLVRLDARGSRHALVEVTAPW